MILVTWMKLSLSVIAEFCIRSRRDKLAQAVIISFNSLFRFEVSSNYPRKVVPCRAPDASLAEGEEPSLTFGQFGIAPRTVLFVKDLDA